MTKLSNVFKKFGDLFSKLSIQIAITVTILCVMLFAILNVIVIEQSKSTFTSVIQSLRVKQFSPSDGSAVLELLDPFKLRSIGNTYVLQVNSDGTIVAKPLIEQFTDLFQSSILGVMFLGIILSILIGFLTSKVFTRTLNNLGTGMKKLRVNEYKFKLEETGTDEFDAVIKEFNLLTSELQKVEDLRKDLISDTSHELKTPITSLQGQLEGVRDGVLVMDKSRASILLTQVKRLSEMVEGLQEFSRLRNKNQKLNIEKIDFKDFIAEVFDICKTELKKKNIDINYSIPENFTISGDRELLSRVFLNLLQNTLNYSKATNIYIKVSQDRIIFSDDGVGIGEEHLPYIFERFYRVEKSRNRNTGGLGLGLAIVKEIIESHGWKIHANKPESGSGVDFVINF